MNGEGSDLTGKQNLLESPEGGLTQHLDSNISAHFSLKVNNQIKYFNKQDFGNFGRKYVPINVYHSLYSRRCG